MVHDYDGQMWWCPAAVQGVLPCDLDGAPGRSFYLTYVDEGDETPDDAWMEEDLDLYNDGATVGGWRVVEPEAAADPAAADPDA